MKNSEIYNKYQEKIEKSQEKLSRLIKILDEEKKEFENITDRLKKAKSNTRKVGSLNAKSDKRVFEKRKIALAKENKLYKEKLLQQAKIKKVNESIRLSRTDVRQLKREKGEYTRAGAHFHKEWNYYIKSQNQNVASDLVSHENKQISAHIRSARALLGLTKGKFALLIDVEPSMLSDLEQPSSYSIFQAEFIESIYEKIENSGVEIIQNGFHVGVGGVGVRLKSELTSIDAINPAKLKNSKRISKSDKLVDGKAKISKVA